MPASFQRGKHPVNARSGRQRDPLTGIALREDLLADDQGLDRERVLEWCRSRSQLLAELRQLRDERDRLARRLGEAERVRATLTTSTSWKVTRPLREVAAALRGGR